MATDQSMPWLPPRFLAEAATLLAALCFATGAPAASNGWPQFRGPNGGGTSPAAKPPVEIGPNEGVLWKVEVPWSPSSPILWEARLFLSTFHEGQLETRAHERRTGRLLWAGV